jgi:hypothetical protein
MNSTIVAFARQEIKSGLARCTSAQRLTFMRMYSHQDLSREISVVVDAMPDEKLDWALSQVQRTIQRLEPSP